MAVSSPLPTDTRSRLADWLEVLVLSSTRGVATRADVLGLFDLLDDDGHEVEEDDGVRLEEEILEDKRLASADVVLDEIDHRTKVLGDYYPFVLQVRGPDWRLSSAPAAGKVETTVARACYTFCLLTSAIRDRRIQGAGVPPLERTMPIHFQAIASEAAAEVVGGISVSFGWPRPEGTGFRPALQDVSQKLKLGKPLDTTPLWSTGREKDAGIDVIAWRDFQDVRPGKIILFGQVASGADWTQKTVKNAVPGFLSWFSEHPTKHYIPAIFIPFPQHHDCADRRDASFEVVAAAQAWRREQEFGLVIDRLRIVATAARRLTNKGAEAGGGTVQALEQWIQTVIGAARAAA